MRVLARVLLGLGVFLLIVGGLAAVWAPGQVKKVPLDINTTTHLSGTVKKLDTTTGQLVENPVKVESISKIDSNASNDDVAVWSSSSCAVIDIDNAPNCVDGNDPRLISASIDAFATDRVTAEAVPDFKGLPADAVPHHGLVNKWPFDAKKKDYKYWDGTTGQAQTISYERAEKFHGIDCYVYKMSIKDAPIEIAEGIDGTYTNTTEVWVEPKTGAVQQQTQSQQRYLDDGTQVLDLQVGFTDKQLQQSADDAKTNMGQLKLLLFWVPLVGFIVGALALIAGILLLRASGRRPAADTPAESRTMAGSAS